VCPADFRGQIIRRRNAEDQASVKSIFRLILSGKLETGASVSRRGRRWFLPLAREQNSRSGLDRVKIILVIDGANTSYSRLTIMYYRRAQPTTRGLEMVMKKATKKGSLKRAPAKKAAKKTAAKKAPAKKTAAKKKTAKKK
jgi:hypothetical protein